MVDKVVEAYSGDEVEVEENDASSKENGVSVRFPAQNPAGKLKSAENDTQDDDEQRNQVTEGMTRWLSAVGDEKDEITNQVEEGQDDAYQQDKASLWIP